MSSNGPSALEPNCALFESTFPQPAFDLACDEALLEAAEAGEAGASLRFWESYTYFVVLGYTNRASVEANLAACATAGVPVLRRCSGGGAVVQGPGCLNYSLVLPIGAQSADIDSTNRWVMERNLLALREQTGLRIERAGLTDLALCGRKFSGNAQRRKRNWLLFHGTLLYAFDCSHLSQWLAFPSRQPGYRAGRNHDEFVANLETSAEELRTGLSRAWNSVASSAPLPLNRIGALVEQKYAQAEWNARF